MGLVRPRGSLSELQEGSKASNWVEAAPGSYQIRHLDTLYLTGGRSGKLTLHTGYLPLDIEPRSVNVSWGKPIDGLRAGLALHDGVTPQILVKEIRTDLYIDNVSGREITIWYIANDDKFFVPEMWNARGKLLKPDWTNLEVEQKIGGTCTLKPGQAECIAHPFFTIESQHRKEIEDNPGDLTQGTCFVGTPGNYHLRMTAALSGHTPAQAGPNVGEPQGLQKVRTMWSYFPTGEISVEVASK